MKKQIKCLIAGVTLIIGTGSLVAQSLDDFLSPANDDPEKGVKAPKKVMKPGEVEVVKESVQKEGGSTPKVKAANKQDAINAGIKKDFTTDVFLIEAGSGLGVVARGDASYTSDFPNRDARLLIKREALVTAYARAKGNLAEFLHGLNNRGEQLVDSSFERLIVSDNTLANSGLKITEKIDQKVEGLLRGYVTYEIQDDDKEENITIYIVTTPKTQGRTMRSSGALLNASSMKEGVEHIFAELKNGLTSPVGGRIVSYPVLKDGKPTGETRLWSIGFGSAIVSKSIKGADRQLLKAAKRQSKDVAKMRAADSLCGIIVGDAVMWKRGMNSSSVNKMKTFDRVNGADPMNDPTAAVVPVEGARREFAQVMSATNTYGFAREGKIPPGCQQASWESADGDWVYHAYIYEPKETLLARNLRDAMVNGPSILERGNDQTRPKNPGQPPAKGGKGKAGDSAPQDDLPIGRLPSGRLKKKKDL